MGMGGVVQNNGTHREALPFSSPSRPVGHDRADSPPHSPLPSHQAPHRAQSDGHHHRQTGPQDQAHPGRVGRAHGGPEGDDAAVDRESGRAAGQPRGHPPRRLGGVQVPGGRLAATAPAPSSTTRCCAPAPAATRPAPPQPALAPAAAVAAAAAAAVAAAAAEVAEVAAAAAAAAATAPPRAGVTTATRASRARATAPTSAATVAAGGRRRAAAAAAAAAGPFNRRSDSDAAARGPPTHDENGDEIQTQNISIPADMVGCINRPVPGSKISEIRKTSGARISIAKVGPAQPAATTKTSCTNPAACPGSTRRDGRSACSPSWAAPRPTRRPCFSSTRTSRPKRCAGARVRSRSSTAEKMPADRPCSRPEATERRQMSKDRESL